jgi:hypothetical protein
MMRCSLACVSAGQPDAGLPVAIAGRSHIDNSVYDDASVGSTWHDEDTNNQLATLQLLNNVSAKQRRSF